MSESSKKKDNVVRAEFTDGLPSGLGNNSTSIFLRGIDQNTKTTNHINQSSKDGSTVSTEKEEKLEEEEDLDEPVVVPSPLMQLTPSSISSSLVKLYPYLIIINYTLGILTWTQENMWSSILMVTAYIIWVSNISFITRFLGHIIIVSLLLGYTKLDKFIEETIYNHATIEEIITVMNQVSYKFDLLLYPLTTLDVSNVERLLMIMIVISPIVIIVNIFILPPRKCFVILGTFLLTYHSPWAKVTRRLLWKFKTVRKLIYYSTGLNLGGIDINDNNIIANVQKQVNAKLAISKDLLDSHYYNKNNNNSIDGSDSNNDDKNETNDGKVISNSSLSHGQDDKPIKFTYVLYENQRHWIGMGWKSSMLNYERTSWTDEFLNEAPSPEEFQLPPMDSKSGMRWRWLDKTWRLDLTNDGSIEVGNNKMKTTADPTPDQGFIYYDNSWKKPSTEESFSKYTRRRRWIRTAELIRINKDLNDDKRDLSIIDCDGNELKTRSSNNSDTISSGKTSKRNSRIISNTKAYDSLEMKITNLGSKNGDEDNNKLDNDDNNDNTSRNKSDDFLPHDDDSTHLTQLKRSF